MPVNAIFACDENNGIGKNNDLPWPKNPADLLWFRNNTEGHVVVMGRKTWESLGNKKLPRRINIVVTSKGSVEVTPDDVMSGDMSAIITNLSKKYSDKKIWIIGGADIYRQAMPYCNNVYMTKFKQSFDCDTFIQPTWLTGFRELAVKKTDDANFYILGRIPS